MNEASKEQQQVPVAHDFLPIPYLVIIVGWLVLLVIWNRLSHEIPFLVWLLGPALLLAKVYLDAQRIGRIKDNPVPITYNFHAPGVWAQLDETIKTLPGSFKNIQVHPYYQNLNPPKGMPMQLHATITLRHPEVDKNHVPESKRNDMKSTLTMIAAITPMGNQSQLKLTFQADPLISRQPLDEIIDHINKQVDTLVKLHAK